MNQFQLHVVFSGRAAPRERRLPLGSTWRFQTHFPSVSRCKMPHCCRLPARSARPPLKMHRPRRGHWLRWEHPHPTICLRRTPLPLFFPLLKRRAESLRPAGAIPFAQASAPTSRFGSFIINAALRLTQSRPLPALKRGSCSSQSSCTIMLRPSMPWSRGCPPHLLNGGWLSTSSPEMVRLA